MTSNAKPNYINGSGERNQETCKVQSNVHKCFVLCLHELQCRNALYDREYYFELRDCVSDSK